MKLKNSYILLHPIHIMQQQILCKQVHNSEERTESLKHLHPDPVSDLQAFLIQLDYGVAVRPRHG